MKLVTTQRMPTAGAVVGMGAAYFGGMADVNAHVARVAEDGGGGIDKASLTDLAREVVGLEPTASASLSTGGGTGYKSGKLYSLDPADGTGDFTVTGGGNAVSQRSDGTWQINWPANTPRYTWNDGVPSIWVESQRQNLITYPRSFDNAYWTKSGVTVDDNAGAGYACPFVDASGVNTNEGFKLSFDGSSKQIQRGGFSEGAYVFSVFVKGNVGETIRIGQTTTGINHVLTGNWDRVSIYDPASAGVSINTYSGVTAREVFVCHAQLEQASTASSPIYGAEGSALTRNADVITKTDAADLIGQTEGTIVQYLNVDHNRDNDFMSIQSDVGVQRYIAFGILSNQISVRFRWYNGIANQSYLVQTPIPSTGGIYKIGISYKNNEVFVCVNGVQIGVTYTENWSITTGTLITINIGNTVFAFGNDTYNNSNVIISKTAISLEQLQALTTL